MIKEPKKELVYKETRSEKQDEETKKPEPVSTSNEIKWSIKQSMFVKINSHQNVSEFYLVKEMIG